MRYARIYPWRRTRRSRAPSNGPEAFFVAQFSAGYTTNMFGFDLRQGQDQTGASYSRSSKRWPNLIPGSVATHAVDLSNQRGLQRDKCDLVRVPLDHADRSRIPSRAGIEELRAVGHDNEAVFVSPEFNEVAWSREALNNFSRAIDLYRNVHEEVDVSVDVSGRHAALRQGNEEVVAACTGSFNAISQLVHLAAACATDGIVPSDRIFDHRHQNFCYIRIELETFGYIDRSI